MRVLKVILLCVALFPLCGTLAAVDYKTESGIQYRSEEEAKADPYVASHCVLDVYHPEAGHDLNTLVWFHGGGLSGGDKHIPAELKNSGLIVVPVRYRLSPKVKGVDCVDDAAAALAWTFKNISKHGGSPDKIFVSGHSAGGYLAAMVGLDKSYLGKYGVDANKIAGLIPLSGHTITHFAIRQENGVGMKTPVVDKMAPLYHVRRDLPPILLITGDREKEMLGRYEENAYLMRMLKVCGAKDVTLYEMQGYGHGMVSPAIKPLLDFIDRISPEGVTAFDKKGNGVPVFALGKTPSADSFAAPSAWSLLGPIPYEKHPRREASDACFTESVDIPLVPDESALDGATPVGAYKWTRVLSGTRSFVVDVDRLFPKKEFSAVYAFAKLEVPEDIEGVVLKTGSDDYLKIWIDGQAVMTYNAKRRGCKPDSDSSKPFTLKKGLDTLLVKCVQIDGAWAFSLRFVDSKGKPLYLKPVEK